MGRVTSPAEPAAGARFHTDRRVIAWSWRDEAACAVPASASPRQRERVAEAFFPVGLNTRVADKRAKKICAGCPVREVCLADALLRAHADEAGVRGGMTFAERAALKPAEWEAAIAPFATPVPKEEL